MEFDNEEQELENMEPVHPKAYLLTHDIHSKVAMSWKISEEDELVDGLEFMKNRLCVDSASSFKKFLKNVARYLTFILHDKADVVIIQRKLRHLTDVYRHFKLFIFMKDGVAYNPYTNKVKVGPKYWKNIEQETELHAYFRVHGFRLYKKCYKLLEYGKLEQFSSYIDEDVHMKIPVGIDFKNSNVFSYLKHRIRFPRLELADRNMCYRNSNWTKDNWDRYFFTNGWDPVSDSEFMFRLVEAVNERIIHDDVSYGEMIFTLVREYDELDDPQVSKEGIREKIRSVAYVYQLFKRFAFKTVGVEFNFHQSEARVNENYWDTPGKEPQYMWFFRSQGFTNYKQCFHVFDVMGLHTFAHGDIESIDPTIVDGVEVSDEEDVFKSYYQDG